MRKYRKKRMALEFEKTESMEATHLIDLRKIWGTLKTKKTAQQIKNELRKGWE